MKFKYSLLACSLLSMAACTPVEDIYDEIDAEGVEIVKSCEEYVLTEADYKSISKAAKKNAQNDDEKKLAESVETELALNEFATADAYLPAVINQAFYSWTNGSNVRVTYKTRTGKTELETKYAGIEYFKLGNADYPEPDYGCFAPSASAAQELPKALTKKYPNAAENDRVLVDFNEADKEPEMSGEESFSADFEQESVSKDKPVELEGWTYITDNKDIVWVGKEFSNNKYMQISAFKKNATCDTWAIIPAQKVEKGVTLTFDLKVAHWNADNMEVMITENFDGKNIVEGNWKNILQDMKNYDKVEKPSSGYGKDFVTLSYKMDAYEGKTVYVGFRYKGNDTANGAKATTTFQVDNVKFSSLVLKKNDERFHTLYVFSKGQWKVENNKELYIVSVEDYTNMGGIIGEKANFSKADQPRTYVPVLLNQKFPYAQEGDVQVVVYNVYKVGAVASQFTKTATAWEMTPVFEIKEKENYIKNEGVWKFDPTIVVTHTKDDLQMLVEWVRENKPGYLDPKYPDNSEYWFGGSAYYNNFDLNLNKRRATDPDDLVDDTDDDVAKDYLYKQVAEACRMILAHNYPDAATVINGMDLYYNVEAVCFANGAYTINTFRFKSLGKGEFEWDQKMVSRPR